MTNYPALTAEGEAQAVMALELAQRTGSYPTPRDFKIVANDDTEIGYIDFGQFHAVWAFHLPHDEWTTQYFTDRSVALDEFLETVAYFEGAGSEWDRQEGSAT